MKLPEDPRERYAEPSRPACAQRAQSVIVAICKVVVLLHRKEDGWSRMIWVRLKSYNGLERVRCSGIDDEIGKTNLREIL
jgi:hypothetical protein